ncbi:hypothetical protein [Frankia sp. ACN1ag]|uniref:hypothetical protein n=1 Tax=Frankia sp. ACN1ag TaxID=102891 RepID=UPI00128F5C67|nr:hypothetical protein [Frankia sp. ACN1ag]
MGLSAAAGRTAPGASRTPPGGLDPRWSGDLQAADREAAATGLILGAGPLLLLVAGSIRWAGRVPGRRPCDRDPPAHLTHTRPPSAIRRDDMTATAFVDCNTIEPGDTIRVPVSRFRDGVPTPGGAVLCDDEESLRASAVVLAAKGELMVLRVDMDSFVSDPCLADSGER